MFQIIKEKKGKHMRQRDFKRNYSSRLQIFSVMIRTSTLFSTFHVYLTKWLTRNPHILLDQRWGRLRDSSLELREDRRTTIKQRPYPRKRNKVPKWSYLATQAFRT